MLPKDRSHIETEKRNINSRHLHLKNINECLDILSSEDRKIPDAIDAVKPTLSKFLAEALPLFEKGGRVFYIGAGTSGRLGVLDASEIPPTYQMPSDRFIGIIAGGDSALRKSSEGQEDIFEGSHQVLLDFNIKAGDILIGIAAGGTTPYVLGAFNFAKSISKQILTSFITCASVNKPDHVDHILYLPTGPEVVTGSTRMKAGTATKLILNMISTTLMIQTGRVYDNLMVDLKASNEKLVDRAIRILTQLTNLSREEAFQLLLNANKQVKTALVMHKLKLNFDEAENILSKNQGKLGFLGELK